MANLKDCPKQNIAMSKPRRPLAAGMTFILLLVGFLAEYTHHHPMFSAGTPSVIMKANPIADTPISLRPSFGCLICQTSFFSIAFPDWQRFRFVDSKPEPLTLNFLGLSFHQLYNPFSSFRRAPPAAL
ncbi:MAG: hypothetical protein ONA90_06650 [candidate division KSB1 bacterium]|nr:hypothetical protein [candidate division KSB1 bacterium]